MNDLELKIKQLESTDFKEIQLKTISTIDDNVAKTLLQKHIHFTKYNRKDNSRCIMEGLVLGYYKNQLRIYMMDIITELSKDDLVYDNDFIEYLNYDDISDVTVFSEYNKNFDTITNIIENNDEEIFTYIYKIKTIYNDTFECLIMSYDSFSASLIIKDISGEIKKINYPLYFIDKIELSKVKTIFYSDDKLLNNTLKEKINFQLNNNKKIMYISLNDNKITNKNDNLISYYNDSITFTKLYSMVEAYQPDSLIIDNFNSLEFNCIDMEDNIYEFLMIRRLYNINILLIYKIENNLKNSLKDNKVYMMSDEIEIL